MQLMPVILGMIPGLFLGVRVLLALDANVAKIIAGLVLMGVGGVTLLAQRTGDGWRPWQNSDGRTAIWTMDGTTITAGTYLPDVGSGWHAAAADWDLF
jgi:uncharacterized membrane protein YfcA